jgi:radical SAM superfamily enzyme YgiQ (UPF0313 family)
MEDVGVTHLQLGLESGSQRLLDYLQKDISVDQVIRVNKRLSRYRKLRPIYNLFCGVPGERIEDLKMTKELMLRLIDDNPNCLTGFPANYKPIPGSVLYDIAVEMGLIPPENLEEWAEYDSSRTNISFPWYSKEYGKYVKMLQLASYVIDDKVSKELPMNNIKHILIRLAARLYKPIALYRLRHDDMRWLFEDKVYQQLFGKYV